MGPNDDDNPEGATLPVAEPVAHPGEANAPTSAEQRPDTISTRDPTFAAGGRVSSIGLADIPSVAAPLSSGGDRYQLGELLGKGGMGEVVLAVDDQIGRDVAIKRMRHKPSPQAYARFLREARIQGRLDHPAIVPVHELSIDADGRPFFAMKRLTGTTLYDILVALGEGDPVAAERYPRKRLLRAFADVCLAVEFAHTRGVVHRDLKPANVMLGDFGEVYVLDWGVARVVADAGEGSAGAAGDLESLGAGEAGAPAATEAGAILGTPGYIPPEQIRGDATLDHRADVFALGCLLFEILANEPMLPRGRGGLTVAFGEFDARPSQRAGGKDVPPELDALCVVATQPDMTARLWSARDLGEQVQRYLDGDRDLEQRKKVAAGHLAAARAALAAGYGDAQRLTAMREAARALALDPTATDAADLVGRLMLEPPAVTPHEVVDEVNALNDADVHNVTRTAVIGFAVYLLFLPVIWVIGLRSGWYLGVIAGAMVINWALAFWLSRVRGPITRGWVHVAMCTNVLLIGVISRLLSPFLVAPGLAATTTMAFCFYPALRTWLLWLAMSAAVLVPLGLEHVGVWGHTVHVLNGNLVLTTPALHLRLPHVEICLAAYVMALIAIAGTLARRLAGAQREARTRMQLQAWHLRQLMPASR